MNSYLLHLVTHLSLTRYSLQARLSRQALAQRELLSHKSRISDDEITPEATSIDFGSKKELA